MRTGPLNDNAEGTTALNTATEEKANVLLGRHPVGSSPRFQRSLVGLYVRLTDVRARSSVRHAGATPLGQTMFAKRLARSTQEWLADSPAAPILVPLHRRFSPRGQPDREVLAIMDRVLTARSCCIDIGAHRGNMLREMVRRAPQGTHHAFEPVPIYAARLRQQFGGVTVHEVALCDRPGVAKFVHVTGSPGLSGFIPNARATSDMNLVDIQVVTARLDDELPPDCRPDLVKIDVEGAEHLVLLGGSQVLARARPVIVFECWITDERYEGFSPETMFDILNGLGLQVSLMRRWLDGQRPFGRDEFTNHLRNRLDAHYIAYP